MYKCITNQFVSNQINEWGNIHSKIMPEFVNKQKFWKMLTHALLSLLFFNHGFIQIRFGPFDFFVCFCFMSMKCYLSKLMLLNYHC